MGNRTQRVDQHGTHSYSYDNAYRLTSVTYPGPATTSYTFDAFGNRTSKTEPGSQTTTYAYNDGDRLTSVTPPVALLPGGGRKPDGPGSCPRKAAPLAHNGNRDR